MTDHQTMVHPSSVQQLSLLTSLPNDVIPLVAQYLDTLHDRMNLRHSCSLMMEVSNTLTDRFFEVSDGYGESFVIFSTDVDFYVNYFVGLSGSLRSEMESKGHLSPFTKLLLSMIVRSNSLLMEQCGFSVSKHVTDGFFYCMMRSLLDETTPSEIVDLFVSECRYNSSFWNEIDRIAGYVYPRTLFYETFVRLSKSKRLPQVLPLLVKEAGIRVFSIDFYPSHELIHNSSGLVCNHTVASFTVVHLAAFLKDYDALLCMHTLKEGVIDSESHHNRTAFQLCCEDPNLYDVALFLLENFTLESCTQVPRRIALDQTHPLASKVTETLAKRGIVWDYSPTEEIAFEDLDQLEEADSQSLRDEYDSEIQLSDDSDEEDSIGMRNEQGLDILDLFDADIETIEELGKMFEVTDRDPEEYVEEFYALRKRDVHILSLKPCGVTEEAANNEPCEEEPKAKKPKLVHGVVSREELVIPKEVFRGIVQEEVRNYVVDDVFSPAALVTVQRGCELFLSNMLGLSDKCVYIKPIKHKVIGARDTLRHEAWSLRDICPGDSTLAEELDDDDDFDSDFSSVSSDSCSDILHECSEDIYGDAYYYE